MGTTGICTLSFSLECSLWEGLTQPLLWSWSEQPQTLPPPPPHTQRMIQVPGEVRGTRPPPPQEWGKMAEPPKEIVRQAANKGSALSLAKRWLSGQSSEDKQ